MCFSGYREKFYYIFYFVDKIFKKLPGEARNVPQVSHKTKNLREHFNDL